MLVSATRIMEKTNEEDNTQKMSVVTDLPDRYLKYTKTHGIDFWRSIYSFMARRID